MARNPAFERLPKFRRGPFWLFLSVCVTTLVLADQGAIADKLLLGPKFGAELWLWQPASSLWLFPDGQLGGLFLTLIVQWFLAGELDHRWGTRRYVTFVLLCALAGTLTTALVGLLVPAIANTTIGGSTPIDLAALMGFAVVFARHPLRMFGHLPITGRTIGILAAVLALGSPLLRGAPWPLVLPSAITIVVAVLAAAKPWRRDGKSGKLTSRKGGRGSRRNGRANGRANGRSRRDKKSHLRVVRNDDDMLH